MPALPPAVDLVPLVDGGRCFTTERTVRLADVDPHGLLRLDAVARILQDVAADDVADAGLERPFGWVVRRTLLDVRRPARLGEALELRTFCSGTGRCWAERRTSITGADGGSVEAVSLWVQVDTGTGRPAELDPVFHATYGTAAAGRRVSTRLSLPAPPDGALSAPPDGAAWRGWTVRAADLDVLGHVNNAVHWAALEEVLAGDGWRRVGVGEVEYLAPLDAGHDPSLHVVVGEAVSLWLCSGDRVLAAARWTPRTGAP